MFSLRICRFLAKIICNLSICYTSDILAFCYAELLRMANEPAGCLIFGSDFSKLPLVLLVFRGQLGRTRAYEGVSSTKQRVAPYLVVKFAGISRVNGLGRFGADALLKTFDSVLPCKRNFNKPFNSNFYDKHLYERARMKSAHGTAENIGCSLTTNKDAL